jgi:tRNA dimethylallyltransferase
MIEQLKNNKTGNFFLLAGPCVIEGEEMAMRIAEKIVNITDKLGIPYVFKGSYRKANRSRLDSFMGIGDEKALKVLEKVHNTFGVPTVTDIHAADEAAMAADYVDILQIPAFLCRQTDLLVAAAQTGKTINIKKGCLPVLCGGTGLYLESVLKGYRLIPVPENQELRVRLAEKSLEELTAILSSYKTLHNSTDVDTVKRAIRAIEIEEYYAKTPIEEREFPQLNSLIIGVDIDRELRREKITRRLKQRLDDGMVEEVRRLLAEGIQPDDLIYYGLEYKYLTLYAIGKMTYDEMFTGLETAIHQFAKRQMTWFRGMERRGFTIHWVDASLPMEEKINFVKQKLKEF